MRKLAPLLAPQSHCPGRFAAHMLSRSKPHRKSHRIPFLIPPTSRPGQVKPGQAEVRKRSPLSLASERFPVSCSRRVCSRCSDLARRESFR